MDLLDGSISVLKDAQYFLRNISAVDYSFPVAILSDSTIGQHSRHFIEFYQCLLSQAAQKNINYCKRKRDQQIETDPACALAAINDILLQLENLDLEMPIVLHTAQTGGATIKSTTGRELYYNIEHAIHHLALIKVGLKTLLPALVLPEHFGVAPSTVQHRQMALQQS